MGTSVKLSFGFVIYCLHCTLAAPLQIATSTKAIHLPSRNFSEPLTQGWTASPDGRGTMDIVWSCLVTILLCSWSVLCLQIPGAKDTQWRILWRRCWLTALCCLGPEFTLQLALGQWSSARQSVKDFHASGFECWTMKHAFYANSGGFFLNTPDFKPVPIDAKQLLYLVDHKYIDFPALSEQDIDDKNKMDVLLRLISIGQIIWFSITVIARGVQGLFITGMELTTAAFILCTFGTTYLWWEKGADVAVPEVLHTKTTMATILKNGGDSAAAPYHRTPLDFISREEWHWSLYWTHWINILRNMHIVFAPRDLPHDRIENTVWLNISARGALPAFILICLAYSAIFIAGWNDHFPTKSEQILWRISSLSMMAAISMYFLVTAFAYIIYPAIEQYFRRPEPLNSNRQSIESPPHTDEINSQRSACHRMAINVQRLPPKHQNSRSRLSSITASLRNNSILKDPSLDVPLKATIPIYNSIALLATKRF